LIEVLRANAEPQDLVKMWTEVVRGTAPEIAKSWVEYAQYLGVLGRVTDDVLIEVCGVLGDDERNRLLFEVRRPKLCRSRWGYCSDEDLIRAILNLEVKVQGRSPANQFERLAMAVEPIRYYFALDNAEPYPLRTIWRRYLGDDARWLTDLASGEGLELYRGILDAVAEGVDRPSSEWATSLAPWSRLVEEIRAACPHALSALVLACFSAGITSSDTLNGGGGDLFDGSVELCMRARGARIRAGHPTWWSHMLESAACASDAILAVLVAGAWASKKSLLAVIGELENLVTGLSPMQWDCVYSVLPRLWWGLRKNNGGLARRSQLLAEIPEGLSERVLALFLHRSTPEARLAFYYKSFSAYRGNDEHLLEHCQAIAFEAMRDRGVVWQRELDVIGYSYGKGILSEPAYVGYPHRRGSKAEWFPSEVAARIVEEAHQYPSVLVQAARESCLATAMKEITTVSERAREEEWFDF
jgi:hypothetical protein